MAVFEIFNDWRCYRQNNNCQNNKLEVLLHHRKLSEIKASVYEDANPKYGTNNVIRYESTVRHRSDTCNKGCKGTNDGNESRDNDRFGAIFKVKSMGPVEIFTFEESRVL